MAYNNQLGVVPALAVEGIPAIINAIKGLFGGSSYNETHARILQWVELILADPVGARSGQVSPGNTFTDSAADAYLGLRCWAGDQSILQIYRQKSGDPAVQGCGCEVSHGCRADAQAALRQVDAALNVAFQNVSSAPIPSRVTPESSNTGTIYTQLPGGISIGLPVPGSTILTSSIAGIPIVAIAAGIALLAFAGGSRGRR